MNKSSKTIVSVFIFVAGSLLGGFGYTTTWGSSWSTFSIILGLGFMIAGIVFLVMTISGAKRDDSKK